MVNIYIFLTHKLIYIPSRVFITYQLIQYYNLNYYFFWNRIVSSIFWIYFITKSIIFHISFVLLLLGICLFFPWCVWCHTPAPQSSYISAAHSSRNSAAVLVQLFDKLTQIHYQLSCRHYDSAPPPFEVTVQNLHRWKLLLSKLQGDQTQRRSP